MARKIVCLRYLLVGSFVLLAIFGIAVCGVGSYLLHQLRSSLTLSEWFGPPAILLSTGIVNFIAGPYFCHYFDTKYNQAQLFMFSSIVVVVMTVQAGAGVWALVSHTVVDAAISDMLESKLAAVGRVDARPTWNLTEIKTNCCGFENISTSLSEEDDNEISWACCNTRQYDPDSRDADTCVIFYMNECRHLAYHRYRSILFHSFVLGLCATGFQALVMMCIKLYSTAMRKSLKKGRTHSAIGTANGPPIQNACAGASLGPQHICEGCSTAPYRGH